MKILRNTEEKDVMTSGSIVEKGVKISEIDVMTIKNIGKINTEILGNTAKTDAMNLRRDAKNAAETLGNAVKKLRIDERMTGDIKDLEEEAADRDEAIKIKEGLEEADDRSTSRVYVYQ
jgi:hypothetical protein